MSAEKPLFLGERDIPLSPEYLSLLAEKLAQVGSDSIEAVIDIELKVANEFLLTRNQALQNELALREEEARTLQGQISAESKAIQDRDQRIIQLEEEIAKLKSAQLPLSPAASEKPTSLKEEAEEESRLPSKPGWIKRIFGRVFDRQPANGGPLCSRAKQIHRLDQLRQTPEGLVIAQGIAQAVVQREAGEEKKRNQAKSFRKRLAHGVSAVLVLGSLIAGTKALLSSSPREEERKLTQNPISQTLYPTPAPEQVIKPEVEGGEFETPPPVVVVTPKLSQEKTQPKTLIEVVIPKKGWFWKSAEQLVANWLTVCGYTNWVNEENGVRLSDVITKILVERLKAEGIDFRHLRPGQKFVVVLDEEVVKVAQTHSFQEYWSHREIVKNNLKVPLYKIILIL
ncbi:MAG TPA: hypothetical protein VMW04_00955 [Patescibacteria group bacterium]|nr:hypothetical protein [Patescibacteria group bacterium]